jgi:transposase-like protein
LKHEFARFSENDLSKLRLDYLYLDGVNFKMHEHARPEPVIVAWGIDTEGHPHLVAIEAATSESVTALMETSSQGSAPGALEHRCS